MHGLQEDVNSARKELAALRETIAAERLALIQRIEALQRETARLRSDVSSAQRSRERSTAALAGVRREATHLASVAEFTDNMIADYRRAFETRIGAAEAQRNAEALESIDAFLGADSVHRRLQAVPGLLDLARDHAEATLGGHRFDGEALDIHGNVVRGRFATIGPLTYFAAPEGGLAGAAVHRIGSTLPSVFADFAGETDTDGIRQLTQTGRGTVPVDVTEGAAVKLRQSRETFAAHVRKGGFVMVPLLLLAAVCSVLAVGKFLSLLSVGSRDSTARVDAILDSVRADDLEAALAQSERLPRPMGPVIRAGIEHRDAPKEHIEEIMYERILSQVPSLERLLAPLAVCASVAPLLGLLGTVTGMIHTFRLITVFGTGDAKLLSAGISEALITTEFGLIIAIPALLIHAYLSRRVRKAIAVTQQAAIMFVNGLKLRVPRNDDGGA